MADQPPILDLLLDRTAHPGKSLSFYANATDAQGYALQYSLVNNPPVGASINPTSGLFSWIPTWPQIGAQNVTIRVTDPNGLSDQKSFTVTVANQAPALDFLPDRTAHPGRSLNFFANATDSDGDTLTYSLLNNLPQGATINASSGQFSWTPGWNQLGAQPVTIRVADQGNQSDQKSFTITVANQTPVLDTIPDRTAHAGRLLSFYVNATDPDGDFLQFSLVNPPAGATINANSGQFNWTPTVNQQGATAITVRVTDPGGLTDQKSFTVTVSNQAPVMQALIDRTVTHGKLLSFFANATDPDGDNLQYSLINNPPPGATINPNTGHFTWTPGANQTGAWTITIQATDPGGQSDQKQCTVTVL